MASGNLSARHSAGHRAEVLAARAAAACVVPTDVATLYALGGEPTLAVDWLGKGHVLRDPSMPIPAGERLHPSAAARPPHAPGPPLHPGTSPPLETDAG